MFRIDNGAVRIESNYFIDFLGQRGCRRLDLKFYRAIHAEGQRLYFTYTDRPDRKLAIGDACPQSGPCPGHQGAHRDKLQADLNYYCMFTKNRTHYTEEGEERSLIWDRGKITDNYDYDRNSRLWIGINRRIATAKAMIDIRIFEHTYAKVKSEFGISMAQSLRAATDTTQPGEFNHHLHPHLYCKES